MDEDVKAKYKQFPKDVSNRLMDLQDLILSIAEGNPRIGAIQQTLKWNELAFVTHNPKSGTTLRIGWSDKTPQYYSLFVHCQTNLIETYKTLFADTFIYIGNRGLHLPLSEPVPEKELTICIELALTYHLK